MRIRVWLSILLCISMLAGCSFPRNSKEAMSSLESAESSPLLEDEKKDTLGLTPDFSYEVELQTPNILVNQLGYRPWDSKVAILQGSELAAAYYVYDADTDKVVMAGSLKEAGVTAYPNEEQESQLYLADFTDLDQEGSYYLFHENLGYSDSFSIKEDIYVSVEAHALKLLQEKNQDTSSLCYQLAGMLLILELYPDKIQEEEFGRILEEKITLLIQAQDQKTGSVYETIEERKEPSAISLTAGAEFAGVMAMYADYLKETDWTLANQYQIMAEKAYTSIQNSLDQVKDDAGYFAVSQLFKQTGKNKYVQAIRQYLSMEEELKSHTQYDFSLFGDFAYLSSSYGVNLEWSRQLMNKVMKQAEKISLASSREHYYISQEREHYAVDEILQDMLVMALVNYIITNHEYSTLQKNCRDYLLGRNPKARCLVEGFGTRNMPQGQEEMVDKENAALFYLLLQSTK